MAIIKSNETSPKTYSCDVVYRTDSKRTWLTVSYGTKACEIDLSKVNEFELSEEEKFILDYLDEGRKEMGDGFQQDLTVHQMGLLVNIRDRSKTTPSVKTVATPTAPAPKAPVPQVKAITAPVATPPKPASQANGAAANKEITVQATQAKMASLASYAIGVDFAETRINALTAAVKQTEREWSKLVYDIPASLNKQCPNPSSILWHYGFRLNKSCWVLPTENLSAPAVVELLDHWATFENVEAYTLHVDQRDMKLMKKKANERLTEEIVRSHTALINRIANASDNMARAAEKIESEMTEGTDQRTEAEKNVLRLRDQAVKAAIRDAAEDLRAAIECAQTFDETENVRELLRGLRAAVDAEAKAFNADAKARGVSTVKVNLPV
jgi:hypothetical protein